MKTLINQYNNWKNTRHYGSWVEPTDVDAIVTWMEKIGWFKLIGIKS